MKKRLSLSAILSLLFVGTFIVTVSVFYGTISLQTKRLMEKQEQELLQETSQQLAKDSKVIAALENKKASLALQTRLDDLTKLYDLDFIVVMDMDSIRLTHPDRSQIGKTFQGGDQAPALKGQENLSTSKGTLGESLRYFVPVYSSGTQIGVVAVGLKLTSLSTIIKASRRQYTVTLVICSLLGVLLTFLVSLYLKRQLHNLEPQEIYQLLEERNAMLEEAKDPVFVVNLEKKIQLTNIAGKELGSLKAPLEGKNLQSVLTNSLYIDFKQKTEQLYRQNGKDYLVSVSPIVVNHRKIGYIIFLRNVSESLFVLDQLASTTAYASALQSQSHEFMNKLHVIYGLVDLKEYGELKIYLESILKPEQELLNRFSLLIKEPVIAGFFIGDREKFAERKTRLEVDVHSEIPPSVKKERLDLLINLYRFIDLALLKEKLPEVLQVTLNYEENQLETIYQLPREETLKIHLRSAFQEFYFQQLLQDRKATFSVVEASNFLQIKLIVPYGGN